MSMETFESLCAHARDIKLLESVGALLEWDQQTKMPKSGAAYRAEQSAFLATELHRKQTDPIYGERLNELAESDLASDPHSDTGATIVELRHKFKKRSKLPESLVSALARETSLAQQVWLQARQADDFRMFSDSLDAIIRLKREEAEAVGYEQVPYDALLDDYEPGARTADVTQILSGLKDELIPLIEQICESGIQPDTSLLRRQYPVKTQAQFGREIIERIGFDFDRGRIDTTHHPFCCETGPNDVRITTRYDECQFGMGLFGTMHETGHGLYEQGLRSDQYGLPPGTYCSLAIHESQSRMWENLVGRSRAFWEFAFPRAQSLFPAALQGVQLEDFYHAINDVRPSLIRVEADEATYNLHIIIRFELEQAMISGQLDAVDLPDAWNSSYQSVLGIRPPSAAAGVLQDIHWSAGLIGYFATYSLGNLYASQFFDAAQRELGDLSEQFAKGEFRPLKTWLNERVHLPGARYRPETLSRNLTGQPLSHEPLIRHLKAKLSPIYNLS